MKQSETSHILKQAPGVVSDTTSWVNDNSVGSQTENIEASRQVFQHVETTGHENRSISIHGWHIPAMFDSIKLLSGTCWQTGWSGTSGSSSRPRAKGSANRSRKVDPTAELSGMEFDHPWGILEMAHCWVYHGLPPDHTVWCSKVGVNPASGNSLLRFPGFFLMRCHVWWLGQ